MDEAAHDPMSLPDDLPRPVDDGGAAHLRKRRMPAITLTATTGEQIPVDRPPAGVDTLVLYAYPRTGRPDSAPLVPDWNLIPGAAGCTRESCDFRDHARELAALGAGVMGVSTQEPEYQREAASRLHLSFPLLSDAALELTRALDLPTMKIAGHVLLKRLTLVVREGVIEHVFYPVYPPHAHADQVLAWLQDHPSHLV